MSNTTRRPTVGDLVRVIKTDCFTDAAELKKGDVVKIRHDDKSDRPYRLHSNPGYPSDVYCLASSFELVTHRHPELEALKATHAKIAEEIKALETKIIEEAQSKRPELKKGQLWKHRDGSVYLGHGTTNQGVDLVQVSAPDHMKRSIGSNWSEGRCSPSPVVALNAAVADGMLHGPQTIKEPNK